ncbi:hypothetical protein Arub01_10950 [Actinomadura rubrobrunea]|uniref:Rv2525c-like glycoside hydrolase-like domain-containing protein n=1 Tax=Actinomadura rubrobrunea TaxID=115335 RepID=A0A9W6USP8_9ACTN|nr:DUF1906 domain-containing protein [Actinomadura rubrobrunea]GLW62851.1 hypothetical protein Arub01_10950 [Actinomadura rubrobrunea]
MRHAAALTGLLGVTTLAPLVTDVGSSVRRAEAEQSVAAASRLRIVEYRGVRVPVPADWEVHWLDRDPTRCVRYDRRAVYLGRPGPEPDCPARAVGRTETLHIEPLDSGASTGEPARQRRAGSVRTDRLARFAVPREPDHETVLRLPEAGVQIRGTYGEDPTVLEQVLRGTRLTSEWTGAQRGAANPADPPGSDAFGLLEQLLPWLTGPSEPAPPPRPSAPRPHVKPRPPVEPSPDKPRDASPPKPKAGKPHKPRKRKSWVTGKGFDTCTAPSLRAMAAWRRSFKVANMYIGGAARACAQPNLNRTWVRKVRRMGYRLIPTYVGLQAPCTRFRQRFSAGSAAKAGRQAARDAVRRARALGIPRRNPVYYDMEVYDSRKAWCRKAVLTFVHNWTRALRKLGYVPGVYGSVGSSIRDVGRARGIKKPVAVWFAHWDGRTDPYNCPYMSRRWWPPHRRIKQYRGGHRETHGGVTINIDSNMVDGRVF